MTLPFTLTLNPDELDGSPWPGKLYIRPTTALVSTDGTVLYNRGQHPYDATDGTYTISLPAVGEVDVDGEFGYLVQYGGSSTGYVPAAQPGDTVPAARALADGYRPPPPVSELTRLDAKDAEQDERLDDIEQGGGGAAFDPTPIYDALTTETGARQQGDTALGQRIDDLSTTVGGKAATGALTAETQRAQGAEQTNAGAISTHTARTDNPHGVTKAQVGLALVDNTSDAAKPVSTAVQTALNAKAPLVGGLVPSANLPSFVDDVLEFANLAAFPATGEGGKLYLALDTSKLYRWGGSAYAVVSDTIALGETSSTAYPGDKGKANADAIAAATLVDTLVTGDTTALTAGVTNVVSGTGPYPGPAVSGTYDPANPLRWAVRNGGTGTIKVSFPNVAGTTVTPDILPGSRHVYRQSSATGYTVESVGTPQATQDARYATAAQGALAATAVQAAGLQALIDTSVITRATGLRVPPTVRGFCSVKINPNQSFPSRILNFEPQRRSTRVQNAGAFPIQIAPKNDNNADYNSPVAATFTGATATALAPGEEVILTSTLTHFARPATNGDAAELNLWTEAASA